MFEVCLNYVCEKMWSKKYIKYCKMFIKYALTPLRMDKKKDIKKTLVQTWRPRNYPEAICYFLYHFLCRFNKRWRTEEDRKGEKNKKHLQHQKNCWNWQNSSLCVLWFCDPLYFFKKKFFCDPLYLLKKLKYKRARKGWAAVAARPPTRWVFLLQQHYF